MNLDLRNQRYSIDWPVEVTTENGDVVQTRIFNISMGGLGLLSDKAIPIGEQLQLKIQVPDLIAERILLPNPMPVQVKVIWCRELMNLNTNQVGTEFLYLSPIIRRSIHDAFENFSRDVVANNPGKDKAD